MNQKLSIASLLRVLALLLIGSQSVAWPQNSTTVTCASENMRRNFCNIPPQSNVQLGRQRSDSPCTRGSTWGVQGNQIWVDRGCRADFVVTRGGVGHYPGGGGYRSITVACASENMRRNFCAIPPGSKVQLARQRSDSACTRGSTWGVQGNQIWVDRGCRADFTVSR